MTAFAPSRRPLLGLVAAHGVSITGSTMTYLAIPWFVLETTGSAALTGIAAFAEALSVVVAAFVGGLFVDRAGFRLASVLADLASAATVASIPLLHATGGLAFPLLLLLVFVRSFFDTPAATARAALVPDAAAAAGMPLERANSIVTAVERGARLLGAPAAGILIAGVGASNVLWLDAGTFVASAAIVALVVPRAKRVAGVARGAATDLVAGLRFILREPLLRAIVLTVAVTNFLEGPILAVVLPVYARETLGVVELGLMVAAVGAGALVGAVSYGAIGPRLPRRGAFVGAFLLLGLAYAALAMLPSLPVTLAALAVAGLAAGPINPIIASVNQERVPEALRGRAFGAITATAFAAIPLGMLAAGLLVQAAGVRTALLAIAVCYLGVTLTMAANPAFRGMARRVSEPPARARARAG